MHEIRDIGGDKSRPEQQQTGTMLMVQVEDRTEAVAVEARTTVIVQMRPG